MFYLHYLNKNSSCLKRSGTFPSGHLWPQIPNPHTTLKFYLCLEQQIVKRALILVEARFWFMIATLHCSNIILLFYYYYYYYYCSNRSPYCTKVSEWPDSLTRIAETKIETCLLVNFLKILYQCFLLYKHCGLIH